jgi:type II secretory ATPase GspE/PulE/Tfp pilus assembly ATPase PilB-like protein
VFNDKKDLDINKEDKFEEFSSDSSSFSDSEGFEVNKTIDDDLILDEVDAFDYNPEDDAIVLQDDVLPELEDENQREDFVESLTSTDKAVESAPVLDNQLFKDVLRILKTADDFGVESLTRTRILELEDANMLPPLILKQLQNEHLLSSRQVGRAVARSMGRMEIINFQDVPASAFDLKKEIDVRAQGIMRELRILPVRKKVLDDGGYQLHIAYDSAMRNVILEARLKEQLPTYRLYWHYATREVCGQFWVADAEGGKGTVDSALEAEDLLDRIISDAIDAGSSDIHIDPSIKGESLATIKYRIDGFVRSKETINLEQLERLRVRIENIARMPSVNLSHPNKGAFTREGYDWRVQIQPHSGRSGPVPRIVIRRLQPDTKPLEELGYPDYFVKQIKSAAFAPNGVIFWTGPTGSGKTESIHSAVVSVDPMGRGLSVHTIEDPPEKRIDGYAVQMEISETDPARTGLELLKSSLRADPDVVIVGEVRDNVMAQLVFDAANTGHLVFSTLHTNNAIDGLMRLEELGIQGFLMSYIRGMVAQRLARRLCNHCKVPLSGPSEKEKRVFDVYKKFDLNYENATIYRAKEGGCANCNHSGYAGRIALAEILAPDAALVQAITEKRYHDMEDLAVNAGWKPMGYMGCEHVINGITDVFELQRVVLELSGIDLEELD